MCCCSLVIVGMTVLIRVRIAHLDATDSLSLCIHRLGRV